MSVWQRTRRYAKKVAVSVIGKYSIFKYQYFFQKNQSQKNFKINLLIVKNPKYSELARLCVFSFLHFHPNSKVTLHCDEKTVEFVNRWAKKGKFSKSISVQNLKNDLSESWQLQKMKLIFNLSGTSEIFIDADMRWNGPLRLDFEKTTDVYFFVKEYKLDNNPIFSVMLSNQTFLSYQNSSMFNTSFVCLSGLVINDSEKQHVLNIHRAINLYAKEADLETAEKESIKRISEQLALSLAVSKWDRQVRALKENDGCKDGAFLESSYFGATGFQF